MASATPFVSVKLEGGELSSSVRTVTVEDSDRLIDKAEILFDDAQLALPDLLREQQTVQVELGWDEEHAVLFEGIVVGVETVTRGLGPALVCVTAYDLSYKLMQGDPPPPTHHMGKLSEIIRKVFSRVPSGVTVGEIAPDPDPEFEEKSPLRQAGMKDWQFIQWLAARYGCRAYVEYNDNASKFYFLPASQLLSAEPLGKVGFNDGRGRVIEISFRRMASTASPVRSLTVVDPAKGAPSTSPLVPPPPAPPPTPSPHILASLEKSSAGMARQYTAGLEAVADAAGNPSDSLPRTVIAGLPSDPALADTLTLQDPTRTHGHVCEGEVVGTVMLRAKGKVTLEGVSSWAEGDWYVARAVHSFTRASSDGMGAGTYRTRFTATR